jgi:hypothetical protein
MMAANWTEPASLIGIGVLATGIISALVAGILQIINAAAEVRIRMASLEKNVAEVHVAVNSSATALKEQNERGTQEATRIANAATAEALRVATERAVAEYMRGLAEGQIRALRESGTIRPHVPTVAPIALEATVTVVPPGAPVVPEAKP